MYSSGIPKRAYRLNAKDYTTLVQKPESIDGDVEDFMLFPKPISPLTVPQLGIFPTEVNGSVRISSVENESAAEKAGLQNNDTLLSIDGWKIESIDDVKIAMFDKKKGDTIKVRISRKGLAGEKGLEFAIIL